MIRILKKQLYNFYSLLASSIRLSSIKFLLYYSLFFLLFLALPFYLALNIKLGIFLLFIFYLLLLSVFYYEFKIFSKEKSYVTLVMQEIQEKINTLRERISKESDLHTALEYKIDRYNSFKNIIQQINVKFDLTSIKNDLVYTAFTQIAKGEGVCLLYLVDTKKQRLSLDVAKKQNSRLVIKAKEGDMFDKWVLKHSTSLLIEDIKNDFRFDAEKISKEERRDFSSLISSSLISEDKILGILRIDNPKPNFFTQDDLRFLNTISDLGAVTLENSELFKETQELAIKDDLTAFYRKGYFLERLKEEFTRIQVQKQDLSLMMLDIDRFKEYNDKFGHIAGDIVLRNLAHTIISFFKEKNIILCRFGGEEFCMLLPEINKNNAISMARQLRKAIQDKEIILRRVKTKITVSIGVASYPKDATSQEDLLHKADMLLYQAKQGGRNRVCFI